MHGAVAKLEDAILSALARGDAVDACAILFLLRRYYSGARDDLADVVGAALAGALDAHPDTPVLESADRLALFVEASALSDDERLVDAAAALVVSLRAAWQAGRVEDRAAAIGACLLAAARPAFQSVAADAIDELERLVRREYEPGQRFGETADQVRAASTLLTAYDLSGRLPYSMLAEELMQIMRGGATADFAASCEAARVFSRLAALHADAGYRAAAIVTPGADYRVDAQRLLDRFEDEAVRRAPSSAIYGLALLELKSGDSL